jgi:hypothetical protein
MLWHVANGSMAGRIFETWCLHVGRIQKIFFLVADESVSFEKCVKLDIDTTKCRKKKMLTFEQEVLRMKPDEWKLDNETGQILGHECFKLSKTIFYYTVYT